MDLVRAAREVGDAVLRPAAEQTDVAGVPRSHVDALATAGLLAVHVPAAFGGKEAGPDVSRQVVEILAAADATTWFVWTQHHTPVRTLVRGTNHALAAELLPKLATGDVLAGVAYTHLRRPGAPPVRAQRTADGWLVTGEIAWLTSWGLAEVFLVGAQADDDVVWLCTTLRDPADVEVVPLALAAMGGTHTVRVRLTDLQVADADVVLVEPLSDWRGQDARRTADVSPAVFGVTAEAGHRLSRLGTERGDAGAVDLAAEVSAELSGLRAAAYELMDDAPPEARRAERLELRARAHALSLRATAGLVAAGAGRSMTLDNAAQRLARVALFLLVQGQTADVRAATLRALGR